MQLFFKKRVDRAEAERGGEPMVGRDFGGCYRIDAEIGQGGVGVVYRAVDRKLGRPVALKLLRSEAVGPTQRPRFEREAKALAALKHPNIVAILDCGVSESVPFLVMELLEGQSLAEALGRGPFPLARAELVIRELLSALACVHVRGLVHRDLKPGNVFLQQLPGGGEQVKLLDFGLAKFVDREAAGDTATLTRSGEVFGTPAYMPPEQWTGQAVDARADVYSAGVICFEMLAGRKPFLGAGQELLRRQLIEVAPLLHEACPERVACPELERLLQRALAKQIHDRQRDATELASELAALPQPWFAAPAEFAPRRPVRAPRARARSAGVLRAIAELLRRLLLASAWTLTIASVLAIGVAAVVIYIMRSPDRVEQRAALEQALPPLRDAVKRGGAAVKNAMSDATERVSAAFPPRMEPGAPRRSARTAAARAPVRESQRLERSGGAIPGRPRGRSEQSR